MFWDTLSKFGERERVPGNAALGSSRPSIWEAFHGQPAEVFDRPVRIRLTGNGTLVPQPASVSPKNGDNVIWRP